MADKKVVFATFSTWVTPTVQVEKGQAWDADDPVVRSHPDWFTEDPPEVRSSQRETFTAENVHRPGVEQATADPGEKRSLTKPADEAADLRDKLTARGVKVDGRWSLDRLRQEYDKATK